MRWAPVVEDDRAEGPVYVQPAIVVVQEAHLFEPIHEETDAGACGPDHLGECFLTELGNAWIWLTSLPDWASNSSVRASRFSAECKS